jgi:hypothetical protein
MYATIIVCSLFNDAASSSDSVASDDRMKNNELESTWKEAVVA